MDDNLDLIRVLSEPETIRAVGLSDRTWDRLKSIGDVPPKTRLSEGRVGYRMCDIKEWLDKRREPTAWQQVGNVAERVVSNIKPRGE